MRVPLSSLLDWLLDRHPRELRPRRARLGVEVLEDRTALSSVPLTEPLTDASHVPACGCMLCGSAASAEYRLGGTNSTNPAGAYKWGQAAKGTPITITYSYSNLLNGKLGGGLPAATLKAAIEEALGRWAAVAPLHFVEMVDSGPMPSTSDYNASGRPMLRFGHRPIDGQYGILANAYYPGLTGLAGDVTFDTAELWRISGAQGGSDFLEVALHEIGHALGLAHEPMPTSGGNTAIMNPFYAGRFRGLGTSFLYTDDINGIRALYGTGVGYVRPLSGGVAVDVPSPTSPWFSVQGSTLTVRGTIFADTFRYIAGPTPTVEVNGQGYTGNWAGITTIEFVGGGGADVLTIAGSAAAETFTLSAGTATVVGGGRTMNASGMTTISAAGGPGDTLILRDTPGDDVFTLTPTTATLASGARRTTAIGFPVVSATSTGGKDVANLYDSAGNDVFSATPRQAILSGTGFRLEVNGFSRVNAHASGGYDVANLYDSAGNDTLTARQIGVWMQGAGYYNHALKFQRVNAYASSGTDVAHLRGSVGSDTFTAWPTQAQMEGPGYLWVAVGFGRVNGHAVAGGTDRAVFHDSPGDDVFASVVGQSSMRGAGYHNVAFGFKIVTALASSGGNDRANIHDSPGNDTLGGSGATGHLIRPGGAVVYFTGFRTVNAVGLLGGLNRRVMGKVSFSLIVSGAWF